MKDIRYALVALLRADPTVNALTGTGSRIYFVQLQQAQRAPSIVFYRAGGGSDYHMLGDSGLQRIVMSIDAWAEQRDAAVMLADATHDAVTGFRGRVPYGNNSPQDFIDIGGIFQTGERDTMDETTALFRVNRDYQISYAER